MSRCVPSWDVEDRGKNDGRRVKVGLRAPSNSMSSNLDVPTLDYEVAELTWKNGQLAMHGLGPPRLVYKSAQGGGGGGSGNEAALTKYTWDKPRTTETLEAIVNQATLKPHRKPDADHYADELVPWLDHHISARAPGSVSASATMTMDALVPTQGTNVSRAGCSTRVGSCSSDRSGFGGGGGGVPTAAAHEWSSCRDQSASGSDTFGMESSRQLTADRELGVKGRFTSTSMGSPDDTLSGKRSTKSTSPDEHDSVCHSRPQKRIADCNRLRRQYKGSDNVHAQQKHKNELDEKLKAKGKSSIATKRSRTAAIHNQSERRRRDKINEKMKTLQKLVPNANKTDKASMLDEVIEYLKQLQAQIQMMGRMNMSPMMMPLAMQQQLQMAMMNPMAGMGMGLGMGIPGVMDLNTIGSNHPGMPPVAFHPSAFMQPMMATSWADMHATGGDRGPNHNDPMATFLASQAQPMTMEGYTRMAAMFQQMQNQTCFPGLKN